MNTTQNITFFMPHINVNDYEAAYELAKNAVVYQMGWPISERRIEGLTYMSNKQRVTAKIGEPGEYEHQYEAVAILESAKFVIVTKTMSGHPGPTILVDTKDVVIIKDFGSYKSARQQKIGATIAQG
jgi:hypothetical protein